MRQPGRRAAAVIVGRSHRHSPNLPTTHCENADGHVMRPSSKRGVPGACRDRSLSPRACREVIGVLVATVQQDNERDRLTMVAGRDIESVRQAAVGRPIQARDPRAHPSGRTRSGGVAGMGRCAEARAESAHGCVGARRSASWSIARRLLSPCSYVHRGKSKMRSRSGQASPEHASNKRADGARRDYLDSSATICIMHIATNCM